MNLMLESSGDHAIGNFDIAIFILSPVGLGFLLLAGITALILSMIILSGLIILAESVMQAEPLSLIQTFIILKKKLTPFAGLAGLGTLILLPVIILTAGLLFLVNSSLLGQHDINYYLAQQPAEFKLAIALAIIIGLPAIIAIIGIITTLYFSLPFILFEGHGPAEALRSSRKLLMGKYRLVLFLVARLLFSLFLLSLALHGIIYLTGSLLVGMTETSMRLLLLSLGLILTANILIATVIIYLAQCALAFSILLIWRSVKGDPTQPPKLIKPVIIPHRFLSYALLLGFLAISVSLAYSLLNTIDIKDQVIIAAHRGSSLKAPENLLSAVKQAAEDGADAAEIDVQRSSDGVIVLAHDKDMMRVAGQPLEISKTPYQTLKQFDIGGRISSEFKGESIATLEEVVKFARSASMQLLIELKSYNDDGNRLAKEIIELLQRQDMSNHIIMMSLNYTEIKFLKQNYPDVMAGFLASAALGDLTRLDVDFLAVSLGMLNDTMIATLHSADKKVCVWTIDDKQTMSMLIDRGVDCIITNTPERLVQVLQERSELSNAERLLLRSQHIFNN
jgi:glycerophosphoryl diester phosphodiesterase